MNNHDVFSSFMWHIGDLENVDKRKQNEFKVKVLRELCHRVITRYVRSLRKREKNGDARIGHFRTAIKTLQTLNK